VSDEVNEFDLEPQSVRLKIGGLDYVLREASEEAAVKYRNAMTSAARFKNGEVAGVDGWASAEPVLVAGCLFRVYEHQGEEKERAVTLTEVSKWPARVVTPLFRRARDMSGLAVEEETREVLQKQREELDKKLARLDAADKDGGADAAKNGQGAMTATSV
jgi:hypothetical protein